MWVTDSMIIWSCLMHRVDRFDTEEGFGCNQVIFQSVSCCF